MPLLANRWLTQIHLVATGGPSRVATARRGQSRLIWIGQGCLIEGTWVRAQSWVGIRISETKVAKKKGSGWFGWVRSGSRTSSPGNDIKISQECLTIIWRPHSLKKEVENHRIRLGEPCQPPDQDRRVNLAVASGIEPVAGGWHDFPRRF